MKSPHMLGFATLATLFSTGCAFSDALNVVCSNEQKWCALMARSFEEATGINVTIVRKSTGETLAQVRAEAANPKIDVWWGGTGDPHLIAAAEGLTQASGVDTSELLGWAVNFTNISGGKTIGTHAGALGIGYNIDILADKGIAPPACWKDLTNPEYLGEIQMANPNSSGTAYTQLATFVQVFGEDEAFGLLAKIGENVSSYTNSGSTPTKAAARGEIGISVGFMHHMVMLTNSGFPLEIVSPCEGTGYEVGGVSVIKGAKNFEAAKAWVEFAISAPAQSLGRNVGVYNVPSNSNAAVPPQAPRLETIKLIDYDFATYGATTTRERLLARWDKEVNPD